MLEEYCKRESSDNRDPVANYCYQKLSDSKFKVTLTALGDVLGELAQLCLSFQRRNPDCDGRTLLCKSKD